MHYLETCPQTHQKNVSLSVSNMFKTSSSIKQRLIDVDRVLIMWYFTAAASRWPLSEIRHSPNRSSFTSLAALSPSSRRFLSIILDRSAAALSSWLTVQPWSRMRASGATDLWVDLGGKMKRYYPFKATGGLPWLTSLFWLWKKKFLSQVQGGEMSLKD